jgi:hypothetical protein
MNENSGTYNESDEEELDDIKEETNAMFDDYATSGGGPLRDGMAATNTINSSNSNSNVTLTTPASSSKRRQLSSGSYVTVNGKNAEAATQVSNNDELTLPPPLPPQNDAAIGSSGAEDSAFSPSNALQQPLTFFCHPETLENWTSSVDTMRELLSSPDPDYVNAWALLQTVPRLPCFVTESDIEAISMMNLESNDYETKSNVGSLLDSKDDMITMLIAANEAKDKSNVGSLLDSKDDMIKMLIAQNEAKDKSNVGSLDSKDEIIKMLIAQNEAKDKMLLAEKAENEAKDKMLLAEKAENEAKDKVILAKDKVILALKAKDKAKDKMNQAKDDMNKVMDRLTNVHWILKCMAGLSQAEPSKPSKRSTEATGTCSGVSPFDKKDHEHLAQIRLKPGEDKRPKYMDRLEHIGQRSLTSLGDLGNHRQCVELFNSRYQHMLKNALKNPDHLHSSVDLTVEDRHQCLKHMAATLLFQHPSTLDDQEFLSNVARCIPFPRSNEVDIVRPYLGSFLRAFGSCLDDNQFQQQRKPAENCQDAATPIKHILENRPRRYIRGEERVRIADGSIAVDGRFINLFRDDSLEMCLEIKTELRASNADPMNQIHIGCDQAYSHLARHLGVLFNFCGVGVNGKATGVVMMPSCIKIIQLCLNKMGTKEVTLTAYESELLPLMTVENFDLWATKERNAQKKLNTLRNALFPSNPDRESIHEIVSTTNKNIPSGIVALATLLVSRRSDLFGTEDIENDLIGTLLGHGSFSCVYSHKKDNDAVVKVSRYGAQAELEREAGVLEVLTQKMADLQNDIGIVRLLSHANLTVRIGGIERELSANILSPRGVLLERVLPSNPEDRRQQLFACGKVLKSALHFLHKHNYTHNDVSPNNIMFEIRQPGRPFLIDFGLATQTGDKVLKNFQGTPPYAHSDIFRKHRSTDSWFGIPRYDFAGLAFSMATLLSIDKRRPWSRFQPCKMSSNMRSDKEKLRWTEFLKWVNFRSDTARTLLKDAGFGAEWLEWCNDKIDGMENDNGN